MDSSSGTDTPRSVREAADQLHASEPTVRKLIETGELSGTVRPHRGRRSFATTQQAIDDFLLSRGPYPSARRRPASRLSALERRLAELERQPDKGPAATTIDNRALRAVIRAQSAAIEHLDIALKSQSRALDLHRQADAAAAEALTAALRAHDAQRSIVSLHGIPDDVADL